MSTENELSGSFVLMRDQVGKALRRGLERQAADPRRDFAMAGSGSDVYVCGDLDLDDLAAVIAKNIVP